MATIDENIKKLSKLLKIAGFEKYTEEYIHQYMKNLIDAGDAKNRTQALVMFKSDPEVKRGLNLGELKEVQFDVLAVRYSQSFRDRAMYIQEVFLVLDVAGKPELRRCTTWDGEAPVEALCSYKAKANIGTGDRIYLPPDEKAYTKLDKKLFTANQLLKHVAVPVEEFEQGQTGMVWGIVGMKTDKYIDIGTDASINQLKIFPDDDVDTTEILPGDTVIACGYHGKAGLGARYLQVVSEEEQTQTDLASSSASNSSSSIWK